MPAGESNEDSGFRTDYYAGRIRETISGEVCVFQWDPKRPEPLQRLGGFPLKKTFFPDFERSIQKKPDIGLFPENWQAAVAALQNQNLAAGKRFFRKQLVQGAAVPAETDRCSLPERKDHFLQKTFRVTVPAGNGEAFRGFPGMRDDKIIGMNNGGRKDF